MFLCRPALLECWGRHRGGSKTGVGTDLKGIMGFCVGGDLVFQCLSCGLLGVFLSPRELNFCPFVISLSSLCLADWCVFPFFWWVFLILLNCGDWHFGLWVREWAVSWVDCAWFLVLAILLLRLFLDALFDRVAVIVLFCFMYFLLESLPMPVLEIKMPALYFRQNMVTLVPWENNAAHWMVSPGL